MNQILEYWPILIEGTMITIGLTVASAIVALVISFIVGLSRFSRHWIVRAAAVCYLEFFRGTSAIVQMFFMFYVLPPPRSPFFSLYRRRYCLRMQSRQLWFGSSPGCSPVGQSRPA